ncbi:MAG: NAD/NADP octopine/nopaline dehydrogenase family protein [Vicinamibacteria bacterium]
MGQKVAVLGTGNAGASLAGVFSLAGVDVSLAELPEFEDSLRPMVEHGGVDVQGEYGVGLARPSLMTTELGEAIRGRKLLMFCHPAYAHEAFTRACAPFLEDGQVLVYISYFGAMRMARLLSELNVDAKVTVAETLSFVYACDKTGPHHVLVKRRKEGLPFSAFPARKTGEALESVNSVFEDFLSARNCLDTSINNVNPCQHTPGIVLNAGWIEATQGGFAFYTEGVTPAVVRLQNALEEEKMEIAGRLGLDKIPTSVLARRMYRKIVEQTGGATIQSKYYADVKDAPKTLKHRYLVEDAKFGLVPISSIGRELGIETPMMDSIVRLGSVLSETDLALEGITAEKLGLSGLTAEEMNEIVQNGYRD